MKVAIPVSLDGQKEKVIIGDAPIFDRSSKYRAGCDTRLSDIGFWLNDWKFADVAGARHKSRVFIPWTSALYIEEVANEF